MRVLICGGGVIGASIAYFLSCRGVAVTVIERTGVACAASGKAGGFLARDWCDGTPLEALARRSFALHARLAARDRGRLGLSPPNHIRRVRGSPGRRCAGPSRLDWLSQAWPDQQLGSTATTAQVHPKAFTAAMMGAAQRQGAELRIGEVTGVVRRGGTGVAGVEIDGEMVEADAVVIAMGPWSILAARWLPLPRRVRT